MENENKSKCSKYQELKDFNCFHKNSRLKNRWDSQCREYKHTIYIENRDKILAYYEDQCYLQNWNRILVYVKRYNTRKVGYKESKKSNGVKKSVVINEITFNDFKKCLDNKIKQYKSMNIIKTYKDEIYTAEMNKIVLSADDDKREILKDGINTFTTWSL